MEQHGRSGLCWVLQLRDEYLYTTYVYNKYTVCIKTRTTGEVLRYLIVADVYYITYAPVIGMVDTNILEPLYDLCVTGSLNDVSLSNLVYAFTGQDAIAHTLPNTLVFANHIEMPYCFSFYELIDGTIVDDLHKKITILMGS